MGLFSSKKKQLPTGNIQCCVCGMTLAKIRSDLAEWERRKKQLNIGLSFGSPVPPMLQCPSCGEYACARCGLDGEEMKRCPKCNKQYTFESIVQ